MLAIKLLKNLIHIKVQTLYKNQCSLYDVSPDVIPAEFSET